jgi:hypothetical protein
MKALILFITLILLSGTALAATATSISGTITDYSTNEGAPNATVTVNCEHNGINTTKMVQTDSTGEYYAFYPALQCNVADKAFIYAEKDGQSNTGEGIVAYDQTCQINTAFINVTIPEFGLAAGAVALIGLVAGVTLLRKKGDQNE